MNQDIEKVWRDEFEKEFLCMTQGHDTTDKMRLAYLSARRKGNEEIEKRARWNELYSAQEKEIAQLKSMNETQYDLIVQLKEELKLERECTDFYANKENWEKVFGWVNGNARLIKSDTDYTCSEDVFNGYGIGGKRAREIQSQRKCEV